MDLLEFIKNRNAMTKDIWEDGFEKREREIIVLRHEGGGASERNGFWEASAYFLAYIDCDTGVLHKDEGRLVWAVSDGENEKNGCFERFADETIYRIKARAKILENIPEGILKSSQNQFLVVEIIKKNARCLELEEILTEYQKPIILQDDILGILTLNKRFSRFEGAALWRKKRVDISLEINKNNKGGWTKAIKSIKAMLSNQEIWDEDMRKFAANKLTALACEWRESADETAPKITEQSFAERIELRAILMTAGGAFTVYFDDDDMFFGHCVTVRGSLKKGVASANIEG